jgi:hypothetical protein
MDEHGWYAHFITEEDSQSPTGYNLHTHGLEETLGIDNFQIVAGISLDVAHSIFHAVIGMIKEGKWEGGVHPGKKYFGWGANPEACLAFHPARETGRNVWRIILPDTSYRCLPDEDMDEKWATQYGRGESEEERDS